MNPPLLVLCSDILGTAIEGGIGYWCSGMSHMDAKRDYLKFTNCCDAEDGTPFDDITLGTVELGMHRIAAGHVEISSHMVSLCKLALLDPLSADIDADAADCIVQVGLFGELVYG